MSGIIGGQNLWGSKSGVIGQTELDYEEGTWTPNSELGTMSSSSGRYTRVGNLVMLTCAFTFGSGSSASSQSVRGQPFALRSTSGLPAGGGYSTWSTCALGTLTLRNEATAPKFRIVEGKDAEAHDNELGEDDVAESYNEFTIMYHTDS